MSLWTYLKASGDSDVHEPVDEHALMLNYVEGEVHCPGEVDPTRPSLARFVQSEIEKNPGYDFADGVSEDVITSLSRCRWLRVIARNTAFSYKDKALDVRQISEESFNDVDHNT